MYIYMKLKQINKTKNFKNKIKVKYVLGVYMFNIFYCVTEIIIIITGYITNMNTYECAIAISKSAFLEFTFR